MVISYKLKCRRLYEHLQQSETPVLTHSCSRTAVVSMALVFFKNIHSLTYFLPALWCQLGFPVAAASPSHKGSFSLKTALICSLQESRPGWMRWIDEWEPTQTSLQELRYLTTHFSVDPWCLRLLLTSLRLPSNLTLLEIEIASIQSQNRINSSTTGI